MGRDRGVPIGLLAILAVAVLLLIAVGCAVQEAQPSGPRSPAVARGATEPASKITLTGKLSAPACAPGEDIHVTAVVTNGGDAPVTLQEGHFVAIFIVDGEPKTFLQGVRASYASGPRQVTVKPGETYDEQFVVMPKDWGQQRSLPHGKHRMRISYRGTDGTWHPAVERQATRIEDGALARLDSDEIAIEIR